MIKYFQNKFALSQRGAKDLLVGIFWHSLLNLSFFLPVIVTFAFLDEYIGALLQDLPLQRGFLFYLVFGLVSFVIMYAISYIDYQKLYTKIYTESANRRIDLAQTLRKLPLAFFGQKDIADLSSTIMEDVTQMEEMFSHSVPQIFAAVITMTITIVAMFFYNWQMSLAVFWVVPIGFLMFYLSKSFMSKGHTKVYKIKRQISAKIQDGIDMAQEIKSYNQEKSYLSNLDQDLENYEQTLIKSELVAGALMNISYFLLKLGLPSVVFVGAYLLVNEMISVFVYLVFLVIVGRIYDPFIEAMNNFAALLFLNVRIKRMKEMDAMPRQEGKEEFNPKSYDINFENVHFSYKDGTQTISDVSFVAKQGEITALVGPSGGGKSTLAKLAARFWDIQKGTISIGGEDISKIDPERLLTHFSIVFQDVMLFNSSVMENIRLGKKDASDEEVKNAAHLAMCDDFIDKLPQKFDTLIGENGQKLSGGERQRISIARAMLKNAPIILLDEATASLDAQNESKIQRAISTLVKNKTVLIIAHRMRTIAKANKVVAIKNGQISQSGKPQDLINEGGIFAQMVEKQLNKNTL